MTELFTALGNFGFPIVISVYLLVRFEKKLDDLTIAITKNNSITENLVHVIEKLGPIN